MLRAAPAPIPNTLWPLSSEWAQQKVEEGRGNRGWAAERFCLRLPVTGHPGRGFVRPPSPLPALPRPKLLTLLQGDEHAARQPALLEEPSQLRQELEHNKPGPVRQPQTPFPPRQSPCPSRRRRQRSRAKPRTASVPQPASSGYTCSLSSSTILALLAPLGQHKPQTVGAGSFTRPGRDFRHQVSSLSLSHPIPASTVSPPHPPRARAQGRPLLFRESNDPEGLWSVRDFTCIIQAAEGSERAEGFDGNR